MFSVICSNSGVIIRAHDKTLWAIGIGEYDRNGIPTPVPVQEEELHYDPENPPPFTLACIATSTRLVKGHNRVGLLKENGVYSEIVLYEREAYIQPILDESFYDGIPSHGTIVDLSIGWQHTLATVHYE